MTQPAPPAARQLRWSLWAGAAYFAAVALTHTFGIKLPVVFIYFDVPSHPYQDQIIGFLAFGWSAFFYTAARAPREARHLVAAILAAGLAAVAGLAAINLRTDFSTLTAAPRLEAHWIGCAGALGYWAWMLRLYLALGDSRSPAARDHGDEKSQTP